MLAGASTPASSDRARDPASGGPNFDTAVFSARSPITRSIPRHDGTTVVTDNRVIGAGVHHRRHRYAAWHRAAAVRRSGGRPAGGVSLNNAPVGQLTISDDTPAVNQLLTVSNAAREPTVRRHHRRVLHLPWQVERIAGHRACSTISSQDIGGSPSLAHGPASG